MDLTAGSNQPGAIGLDGEERFAEVGGRRGETERQVATAARQVRGGEVLAQRSARRRMRPVVEVLPEKVAARVGLCHPRYEWQAVVQLEVAGPSEEIAAVGGPMHGVNVRADGVAGRVEAVEEAVHAAAVGL